MIPKNSISFEAIGTHWLIDTPSQLPAELVARIHERIEAFDKTYSRFRKDSLVWEISQVAGTYTFPDDSAELFTFYEQLYRLTEGKVTPLIGSMLEKAGYDADYSFASVPQKKLPALSEVIHRRGNTLEIKQPVTIDIGAAGKGYLVDMVCMLLDAAGIDEYVVNASGDLRHKGSQENRVGLEDPFEHKNVIGVINVENKSLCASAINRRQWGEGQHHVFDPDLMKPTRKVIATWVLADSTMVADGIATALFFTDPTVLRAAFEYDFVRIQADGSMDYSHAFEGSLFS
jgi:thiamine biosynthesis lipoprotein